MIITIHQPEYLPWLGFFNRIDKADVFVILDNVQYQKNGFINRNRLKTAKGEAWLTVPVNGEQKSSSIDEVEIGGAPAWNAAHWDLIESSYGKAPYFKDYAFLFEEAVLKRDFKLICELDYYFIKIVLDILGIKKEIVRASSLNPAGTATDLIVDICKKLGGNIYLAGPGGKNYMELEKFEKERIGVIFDEFTHPQYPQLFPEKGFLPSLSIIDLLFNCGPGSLEIIRSGSKK
ncbi:MAG: WbqC family protein [bacterium]|nr:WbqC family protein [bacterium]